MAVQNKYWIMKSEPNNYSIQDLKKDKEAFWDGVRNYQARNFMMKEMSLNDGVLFYHSNAKPSGVAGVAAVSCLAKPDPTALDKKSPYFDPKSSLSKPRWFAVKVRFKKEFKKLISLQKLHAEPCLKKNVRFKKRAKAFNTAYHKKRIFSYPRDGHKGDSPVTLKSSFKLKLIKGNDHL